MFAQPSQPSPSSFSTPSSTTGSPSKESSISFRASLKPGKINLANLPLALQGKPSQSHQPNTDFPSPPPDCDSPPPDSELLERQEKCHVLKIKLVDFNTYDLIINFGIRETMCLKPLTVSLDRCPFKWGVSKPVHRCSSYVRVSGGVTSLMGMSCSVHAVSSSSEEL
ncbi:hypothetical protein Q7C36_008695 [Tachysurus vachellii]|uniref:Secreted phosphoprotein 24 n=1 Tax=Tachysurus vachellii TaxID=175792 RepID=A0AA88N4R8_TACVA|nr:hypothetical protein Q7C36_008695 [Tachysurus vachellii]